MTDSMSSLQLDIGLSKFLKLREYVFWQVTLNEPQSFDKFSFLRIFTVKNTISRWCNKFKDTVSKDIKTAGVRYMQIKINSLSNV